MCVVCVCAIVPQVSVVCVCVCVCSSTVVSQPLIFQIRISLFDFCV